MPRSEETAAEGCAGSPQPPEAGNEDAAVSAALLNEAMASLGLANIRFDEVDGKAVLRRYCDELSLDRFIGLLLKTITQVHRQRQTAVGRLAEFDETIRRLAARDSDGESDVALMTEAATLVSELRRLLSEPALRPATDPPSTRLTIGRDA